MLNHTLDTWILCHDYFSCKCATRAHRANSAIKNRDGSVDFGSRCGWWRGLLQQRRNATRRQKFPYWRTWSAERGGCCRFTRARRVLSSTSTTPPLHGAPRVLARRRWARERGSAGARGRCPSRRPTLSKPTQLDTTLGGFTPPLDTTAVTHVTCPRAYTRVHTHTCTDDASSPRRRTHAAPRRRGRRRRARSSNRTVGAEESRTPPIPRNKFQWWTRWCG